MSSSERFYSNLPILNSFLDITNFRKFKAVPRDWYIIITDVVNSTKAIEAGRYKDVNLIGACSIIAVLNTARKIEVPFVFGGDGAAILIPPSLYAEAKQALLAVHQRAKEEFNLHLRVGAIPVADVFHENYDVKVAKIRVSENYYQAAFTGDGLVYATQLIKNEVTAKRYDFSNSIDTCNTEVDLSGLECRWQDIPSRHGEIISLVVRAISGNPKTDNEIYREVIQQISTIYGREEEWHPVGKDYLKLGFSYKCLSSETRLRAKSPQLKDKLSYFCSIWIGNILGLLLMKFKVQLADVDWGAYKETVIAATDYKKFVDMLQIVIDGNKVQRKNLVEYLENNYRKGKLVYGLNISKRALMTCLVFERNGHQVHFIDGADGGYTMAAKEMKRRMTGDRNLYTTNQCVVGNG